MSGSKFNDLSPEDYILTFRSSYLGFKVHFGKFRGFGSSLPHCSAAPQGSRNSSSIINHERLKAWSEIYIILPATQLGFRNMFSTITAIRTLYDTTREAIAVKSYYDCFVGFEKAFHSIYRMSLLCKL